MPDHQEVFLKIHSELGWGTKETQSGFGSERHMVTPYYVPMLRDFITKNNVETVADLGCGDFNFGKDIYSDLPGVKYTGYDCCQFLVEENTIKYPGYKFECLDFYASPKHIKPSDLFVLKDVLQHWSDREITAFLNQIVGLKRFKYFLVTNSTHPDDIVFGDIQTGGYRPLAWTNELFKPYNPVFIGRWGKPNFPYQVGDKWIPYLFDTFLIEKQS